MDLDHESEIGSSRDNNNNNDGSEIKPKPDRIQQTIVRGDRVFSFNNVGKWNALISRRKKEPPFAIGAVILNKGQTLSVRWNDGEIENLMNKSDMIAYGEGVFVLDREYLHEGTRVYLVDHPEVEGTVVAKRYLATANCVQDPQIIFDDIDARKLTRHSHGNGYKDLKILYHDWVGITCGYRTRVHLRALLDESLFTVIDNGRFTDTFYIGKEVTIGMNILWAAQWSDTNTSWLSNTFRYYNSNAVVTHVEIEELDVCWFGEASETLGSVANSKPYDFKDAPEKVICYEDLKDVQYLTSDPWFHMTPNSLWIYRSTQTDNPLSHDKWASKWLKVVEWDRWEYPGAEDLSDKSAYLDRDLILQIKFTRSVVDVVWDNGNETTLNSADVVPLHIGSVWSDTLQFRPGSIVGSSMEFENREKYGIVMYISEQFKATVMWITPTPNGKDSGDETKEVVVSYNVSVYDLVEKSEYEYISRVNQCPLVYSKGRFNIGVVQGIDPSSGQVCVKLANGEKVSPYPHELVHYNSDVIYCPKEGLWMSWYEHIIPVAQENLTKVHPAEMLKNGDDSTSCLDTNLPKNLNCTPKKKLDLVEEVPDDNIFYNEDMLPRLRETHFRRTLENEVNEMENLPGGMWLELYANRGDIMSTVVAGPKDTVFEDFLLVFDIFLMEDFPNSDPYLNFRSKGVGVFPRHFCKSGAVFLPEETRLNDEEFSHSFIMNVLLEVKDFMAMPLESILEKEYADMAITKQESSEELHKYLMLSLLDYTVALLTNPPKNWGSLIRQHFVDAMPRIMERYNKNHIQLKRAIATISNEKGDNPNVEPFEFVTIPWSEGYSKSIKTRISTLEQILNNVRS